MKIKENVKQFDRDIETSGGYQYTGGRLSSILANKRMSDSVKNFFNFSQLSVLDCGCGDGKYTKDYIEFGASSVLALDPAQKAIESATRTNECKNIRFAVGDVYKLSTNEDIKNRESLFDIAVLRGVLHHVSDQALAVRSVAQVANRILILEPNGSNPLLKFIEKISKYHVEHEEQSFTLNQIERWLLEAGYCQIKHKYINLVPFFCPDWFAKIADFLTPVFERIPLLRVFLCGQIILFANHQDIID
jgi:2-polyprenyl-3-methyl-5-hydroxy-6-metoxy-1,4-benzoquinol methylase